MAGRPVVLVETVQNLGVNKLSLLLASRRSGGRDHPIPRTECLFRSCSPGSGRSQRHQRTDGSDAFVRHSEILVGVIL